MKWESNCKIYLHCHETSTFDNQNSENLLVESRNILISLWNYKLGNLLKNHETSPSTLTWKWKLLKNVVSDQFTRYSRIFWHENSNLGNVNFLFGTIYHCIIRHRLNFGAKFKLRNLNMNWKSVELVSLVEKAPIVWIYLSVFSKRDMSETNKIYTCLKEEFYSNSKYPNWHFEKCTFDLSKE